MVFEYVIQIGSVDLVSKLLLYDRDFLQLEFHSWRWTPLIEAVHHNHYAVVQCLLQAGAVVNRRSSGGSYATALHQAAYRGDPAMVTLLLDYQADLTLRTKGGHLPIHNASNCYHIAVVHLLFTTKTLTGLSATKQALPNNFD